MGKPIFNIVIRISQDETHKARFTESEVQELIDKEEVVFDKKFLIRKKDRKVVEEILRVENK